MLKLLIITPNTITYCTKKLCNLFGSDYSVQLVTYNSEKDYPYELLSKDPFDLIITFGLVGFEQTTLMGGISYNLVNSKFVNFLLHENLQNETYLREHYPDIPYLRSLQGSEETAETAMRSAVEEVLAECHLA